MREGSGGCRSASSANSTPARSRNICVTHTRRPVASCGRSRSTKPRAEARRTDPERLDTAGSGDADVGRAHGATLLSAHRRPSNAIAPRARWAYASWQRCRHGLQRGAITLHPREYGRRAASPQEAPRKDRIGSPCCLQDLRFPTVSCSTSCVASERWGSMTRQAASKTPTTTRRGLVSLAAVDREAIQHALADCPYSLSELTSVLCSLKSVD